LLEFNFLSCSRFSVRGRKDVGSQTGTAYAWNTAGAIAGSLAGGFGFIPFFTATGTWKLVIGMLVLCAFLAALASQRNTEKPFTAVPSVLINVCAIFILVFAEGPSVAWRHGQLDRMKKYTATPNEARDLLHTLRRDILWQADGIESSIGISKSTGLAFVVNGKCDGNSKFDAGTQVMSGLLAPWCILIHRRPRSLAWEPVRPQVGWQPFHRSNGSMSSNWNRLLPNSPLNVRL
jgi:hypothetical protein